LNVKWASGDAAMEVSCAMANAIVHIRNNRIFL